MSLFPGLERTDNGMKQTSWPEVGMINQKNYYTFVNHELFYTACSGSFSCRMCPPTLETLLHLFYFILISPAETDITYREYMKRDDQILPLRLQAEANRERMIRTAKDRDRALAR